MNQTKITKMYSNTNWYLNKVKKPELKPRETLSKNRVYSGYWKGEKTSR